MARRAVDSSHALAEPLGSLALRAQEGDDDAWRELVDRHAGLVWSIIRTFAIGPDAQDDVFQTVWLRLAESLATIREPERLAAWLARVARNEAVAVYRSRRRVVPSEEPGAGMVRTLPDPSEGLTRSEEHLAVKRGLAAIGRKCQRLLTLLVATPELSYAEVSELLEIPVGSIGPRRARCLRALRRTAPIRGLQDPGGASDERR